MWIYSSLSTSKHTKSAPSFRSTPQRQRSRADLGSRIVEYSIIGAMRKGKPRFPQPRPASNRHPEAGAKGRSKPAPTVSGSKKPDTVRGRSPPRLAARNPPSRGPSAGPSPSMRSVRPQPRPSSRPGNRAGTGSTPPPERSGTSGFWLYGLHAVRAALANPRRHIHCILRHPRIWRVSCSRASTDRLGPALPRAGIHGQGRHRPAAAGGRRFIRACRGPCRTLALYSALEDPDRGPRSQCAGLAEWCSTRSAIPIMSAPSCARPRPSVPRGVIVTERHAAPEIGTWPNHGQRRPGCAALGSGQQPGRAIELLKKANFWCLGFDAESSGQPAKTKLAERVALVLGSEGQGMRRLTRERLRPVAQLPDRGTDRSTQRVQRCRDCTL